MTQRTFKGTCSRSVKFVYNYSFLPQTLKLYTSAVGSHLSNKQNYYFQTHCTWNTASQCLKKGKEQEKSSDIEQQPTFGDRK